MVNKFDETAFDKTEQIFKAPLFDKKPKMFKNRVVNTIYMIVLPCSRTTI